MPEKAKKNHVPTDGCKSGKHTYIVTKWVTGRNQEKAVFMRCRHCLMPMNLEEIESAEWAKEQGI